MNFPMAKTFQIKHFLPGVNFDDFRLSLWAEFWVIRALSLMTLTAEEEEKVSHQNDILCSIKSN